MKALKASKFFEIRFSEIDSMKVAWHGSYVLYLEDAREFWGAKYGLGYQDLCPNRGNGYKVQEAIILWDEGKNRHYLSTYYFIKDSV